MNRLFIFIILILMAIILFQKDGCTYIRDKQPEVVTVHDTTWQVHDSLIIKKLKIKETIYETIQTPPEYIADTSYPRLKEQYDSLVVAYLAKNIYADTLKLDTLGYVAIADTLQKNSLQNRSYKYNYKIPTIHTTTTITKYAPLKNPPPVEKVSDFFSWERKPLVSSPNLSFLKVKIHFVNKKVFCPHLLARSLFLPSAKCLGSLAFSALSARLFSYDYLQKPVLSQVFDIPHTTSYR